MYTSATLHAISTFHVQLQVQSDFNKNQIVAGRLMDVKHRKYFV